MSVQLPQSIAATSGWQLIDWLDQDYASPPALGGIATITLPQLDSNTRWQLTHMVASCPSGAATVMRLYLDSPSPRSFRDGTDTGNFDVADWAMGLMVPPSRGLVAVWFGCNDGDIATLTLQANILRLAS